MEAEVKVETGWGVCGYGECVGMWSVWEVCGDGVRLWMLSGRGVREDVERLGIGERMGMRNGGCLGSVYGGALAKNIQFDICLFGNDSRGTYALFILIS